MENVVLYVEKEKFLRQTFELLFKNNGINLYTTDNIEDNYYLIEDLAPSKIIFDLDSVSRDSLNKLMNLHNVKLIATGKSEPNGFDVTKLTLFLLKPIEINGLFTKIMSI